MIPAFAKGRRCNKKEIWDYSTDKQSDKVHFEKFASLIVLALMQFTVFTLIMGLYGIRVAC